MRFDVEQRFLASPAQVLAVYTDPAFYADLPDYPKVGRPRLVDREDQGDRIVVRVHYRFTADLPSAALAVIDPDKLTWIEETVYDLVAATSTSTLLPDHYPDRLTAGARTRFLLADGTTDTTRRLIEGDLKVRMPLVGGKVEGAIVSGLREHLGDEAVEVNRRLDE